MEFDAVVRKRRSVRAFSKASVDWRAAMTAIDAALQGPFAGGQNNLKFMIIEHPGTIKSVASNVGQSWISNSQLLIVVCSDDSRLEELYGERGRVYSRQQAGAAIGAILHKLVDLGYGSCWVASYADEVLKDLLNVPQHVQIEAILPVGKTAPARFVEKKRKKTLESTVFWESWGKKKRPALFEEGKEDYGR